MAEKHIPAGELLFREGDAAASAFVIQQGTVEVFRRGNAGEEAISQHGAGEIVGEMALFDDFTVHTTSARATSDVTVDAITGDEVQGELNNCPPRLVPIVMSIFMRLKATGGNYPVSHTAAPAPRAAKPDITPVLGEDVEKVIISPDSAEASATAKKSEIAVSHLPFRIGGFHKDLDVSKLAKGNHMNIASEGPPLRVSVNHCEIIQQDGNLYVLDLGSRYGTVVNGRAIGRGKGFYKAPLQKGENTVILGEKKTSPYKLKVIC
ncbi:MAG: cyclic nucleotide-binding domain-containing protein [Alphaproteobacteria bacterium]|nr:cyclic nucleotide-binding domain-containing protein [Alphaproteobacteria bacterium]